MTSFQQSLDLKIAMKQTLVLPSMQKCGVLAQVTFAKEKNRDVPKEEDL